METVMEKAPSVVREKCGTTAGYRAHQHYKETTCQPCRDARAIYSMERYVANPKKYADTCKRWRDTHSERVKELQTNWYMENSERVNARAIEYRIVHPEKARVADAKWRANHPEKVRAKSRLRRARKRDNGHEPYTEADVFDLYGADCYLCHEPIDMFAPRLVGLPGWERGLHMEHVIAIVNGGRDDLGNIRPSHGLCNLEKGHKLMVA